MKKIIFFILAWLSGLSVYSQKTGELWYLPTINLYQANNLASYDLLIIDIENIFNNPTMIDQIIENNPKIKIFAYVNPVEIFDPMFSDKPWGIKLLAELKERPQWWLYQPDGQKLGAWTGMKTMDMRIDCPEIDNQKYWQWIAKKYLEVLKDPRFQGCLIDNVWGDDQVGIAWLANYNGQKGFDFDNDHKADTNFQEINLSWTKGMRAFIELIRQTKGDNFIILANPGNLSYREVDGKQLENFPYVFHGLKGASDWEINLMIAKKFKTILINPDLKDYFFGACSAVLLDNAYLCVGQNALYHDYYDLALGEAQGKTKEISAGLWSRKFQNGSVFVQPKEKKSWIEYADGKKRKE